MAEKIYRNNGSWWVVDNSVFPDTGKCWKYRKQGWIYQNGDTWTCTFGRGKMVHGFVTIKAAARFMIERYWYFDDRAAEKLLELAPIKCKTCGATVKPDHTSDFCDRCLVDAPPFDVIDGNEQRFDR